MDLVLARNAGEDSAGRPQLRRAEVSGLHLGEFVYWPGGRFAARGYRKVFAPPRMRNAGDYLTESWLSGLKVTAWSAISSKRRETHPVRQCSPAILETLTIARSKEAQERSLNSVRFPSCRLSGPVSSPLRKRFCELLSYTNAPANGRLIASSHPNGRRMRCRYS